MLCEYNTILIILIVSLIVSLRYHKKTKIAVMMVGSIRPSVYRIIQNIKNNIYYFLTSYSKYKYQFVFYILTYKDKDYEILKDFCLQYQWIHFKLINPLENIKKTAVRNINSHRLFISTYECLKIVDKQNDIVIRTRLDCTIFSLTSPISFSSIKANTIYIPKVDDNCDNLNYGDYNTMKKVWNIKPRFFVNCLNKKFNNENILYNWIKHNNIIINNQITFIYKVYQSSDSFFNGIRQHSKKSRLFFNF